MRISSISSISSSLIRNFYFKFAKKHLKFVKPEAYLLNNDPEIVKKPDFEAKIMKNDKKSPAKIEEPQKPMPVSPYLSAIPV